MTSTRLLDGPPPPAADTSGDARQHLWCCSRTVALCGTDLNGFEDADEDNGDPVCPLCAIADAEGMPCPVPGCDGGGNPVAGNERIES